MEKKFTKERVSAGIAAIASIILIIVGSLNGGDPINAVVKNGHIYFVNHTVQNEASWSRFLVSCAIFIAVGMLWIWNGVLRSRNRNPKESSGWWFAYLFGAGFIGTAVYKIITISIALR